MSEGLSQDETKKVYLTFMETPNYNKNKYEFKYNDGLYAVIVELAKPYNSKRYYVGGAFKLGTDKWGVCWEWVSKKEDWISKC